MDGASVCYRTFDERHLFTCFTEPKFVISQSEANSTVLISNDIKGAFHYAKDSGNFGWNSNGKVRFGFF